MNFVEGEWSGLLAGLDSGRYDIMVNGVDIDEDRREKYEFSTPYAYNRTVVIVRASAAQITILGLLLGTAHQGGQAQCTGGHRRHSSFPIHGSIAPLSQLKFSQFMYLSKNASTVAQYSSGSSLAASPWPAPGTDSRSLDLPR